MPNTVISYPVPLYQNFPIDTQTYTPKRFLISAISLGQLTTVTTTTNHDYVIGQEVRLLIPNSYKSLELNKKLAVVVEIPSANSVRLNISSVNASPFVVPSFPDTFSHNQAEILAVGDYNNGSINNQGRRYVRPFIPGAFRRVSTFNNDIV